MSLKLAVNPRSGYPLYLQIVDQVQRAIAIGALRPGEQLPTVKQLSSQLVINASTVAKALNELEHLGLITSIPGRGTYVGRDGAEHAARQNAEKTIADGFERVVREARALAIDGAALRHLFNTAYTALYDTDPPENPNHDA
jgi:GntR family transcriptional regulator